MNVLWTDQAFYRLAEIRDFIAKDDEVAADGHIRKLIARAKALEDFPSLGRRLPELPAAELRELIEGNYRIVYRIRKDTVEVLTVFEAHHLLPLEDLGTEP